MRVPRARRAVPPRRRPADAARHRQGRAEGDGGALRPRERGPGGELGGPGGGCLCDQGAAASRHGWRAT